MKRSEHLRGAVYGVFAVLALATGLLAWGGWRLDRTRAADNVLLQLAAGQSAALLELGRQGAVQAAQDDAGLDGGRPATDAPKHPPLQPASQQPARQALQRALAQSTADARRLAPLLPQSAAATDWQAAHARLTSAAQAWLQAPDTADTTTLQPAVDAAVLAATRLTTLLGNDADQHAAVLRQQLRLGLAGLALLLLTLALAVVEPAARAVRRAARRRDAQAAELQRMALVAEHTSALVLVTDRNDLVQWANAAFSTVTGWSLADAIGRRPGELMASAHADDAVLARVHTAIRQGQGARHEWLHRTRDGRDLWLDVDLRPLHTLDGDLTGFVRVASDMTARVQQASKLQALWAVLPAGVMVHGSDGAILEANRAAERLVGQSLAQLQGLEPPPPGWRAVREDGGDYSTGDHPVARTLANGTAVRNETIGVRWEGSTRWLLVNTEPQRDALGQVTGVVACISDITERRVLQERLSDSARTDALTRLPNRAVVMERLQRALAHARRHPGYGFAVLFMDFDRFKQVNDTLGHAAGDDLLRQIAQRLELALRPGDAVARLPGPLQTDTAGAEASVAARLGGDEFVVVLEGVNDAQTVGHIAQRLLDGLGEPYLIDDTPLTTSVSIGVVLCADLAGGYGDNDDDNTTLSAEDVLRNADTAMYEAKRAGRARWVMFDDSMHERVVRALALENDLRRALVADELFVVYQPVVDLATRALDSVEALVRWRHPQRGLVAPVEFISVAEESGLIHQLGASVLRKACMQFMHWRRTPGAPAPRQLAVNLSRAQLERAGLVDEVRTVLQDCGMAPGLLQLEVTESLAAQDERVQSTLRELKTLGVQLALDDFGTGYSSLACLHQMPVDTVKVDRSFVQHAETVEYHRVLIEATIRVARTLGMTTVAEGIETEGQAALMLDLDCDRGQGYLFSPPLEAAALERWVRQQAQRATADTV